MISGNKLLCNCPPKATRIGIIMSLHINPAVTPELLMIAFLKKLHSFDKFSKY